MASFIEGRRAVLEALRSGVPVGRLYVLSGMNLAAEVPEIASLVTGAGVEVSSVSRRWLDERSERGAHQGVVAEVETFAFTPLASVLDASADKPASLIIALDHVTDAGNFGAIARSAEVVGADGILVTKRRSAPIGAGAYKTSAGALAWLPVSQEPNLVRALEACKKAGYWVLGASEHATGSIWEAPVEGRLVIVLGSEESGLSRLTLEACDVTAAIPVFGHVGSLNVAQASAVFAYEWLRRTRAAR